MLLYVDLVGHVVITRHQLDPLAIHVWGIDGCMPPSMPPKKWYVAYIWYLGCFGHPVLLLHVCPNASSNPYAHTHTHIHISQIYLIFISHTAIYHAYSNINIIIYIYIFVNIICMYIYIYEYRYLFTLIYLYMYAEYPSHKFFDYQDAKGDFHQIQNKISHKPNNLFFFHC